MIRQRLKTAITNHRNKKNVTFQVGWNPGLVLNNATTTFSPPRLKYIASNICVHCSATFYLSLFNTQARSLQLQSIKNVRIPIMPSKSNKYGTTFGESLKHISAIKDGRQVFTSFSGRICDYIL